MKFRAQGLLYSELAKSPATAQQYSALIENEANRQQFKERAGNLLVHTIKQKLPFGDKLPTVLFLEMTGILVQQITDWLIEETGCEYNNLGAFSAELRPGLQVGLRLRFIPSPVVRENELPESIYSDYRGEVLADEYCRSAMDPIRQMVLGAPDLASAGEWSLPLAANILLTSGLSEVWRNFISKGIPPARVEGDEDWLTLLAMGASFATYYAWVVAFGMALNAKSEVTLEEVGSFVRRGETVGSGSLVGREQRVELVPTPQFQKLLRHNLTIRENEKKKEKKPEVA